MKYPVFTGRKGSKCYFTYDNDFFNENKGSCIRMVAFHTLYLFGHQANNNNVIVITGHGYKEKTLRWCLKKIHQNKLAHRIFHLPTKRDKSLMNAFDGKILVTKEIIEGKNKPSCDVIRINDEFPSMMDKFHVKVCIGGHCCYCDTDDESDESDDSDNPNCNAERTSSYSGGDGFLVGKQISEWDTSVEPSASVGPCKFCDYLEENIPLYKKDKNKTIINKKDFTFGSSGIPDGLLDGARTDKITMNNLVFNFRDYQFDLKLNGNKCHVTFNPKAIGGYRHASISTGAEFEVHHAIPGTLEHYQTTYVNEINISFSELDGEVMIVSEYKAIDVL